MILGIDTSNYTTSIALVDADEIIVDFRKLIDVKLGNKGIRQSDAFFQHVKAIKTWLETEYPQYVNTITGVAVSTRPRPVENSYMPVFGAGEVIALTISNSLKVPLIKVSHQEGHLRAAKRGHANISNEYLFLHLSGGTTEVHHVIEKTNTYTLNVVAETADISIGQLVDRIGVKTGLSFPCGKAMDATATPYNIEQKAPPFKVKDKFNLSGYENYYTKIIKDGLPKEKIYYHLFYTLHHILVKLIDYAIEKTGCKTVLLAGGVAASQTIRKLINEKLPECNLIFSEPRLSSDNACGVALIGQDLLSKGGSDEYNFNRWK